MDIWSLVIKRIVCVVEHTPSGYHHGADGVEHQAIMERMSIPRLDRKLSEKDASLAPLIMNIDRPEEGLGR